MGNSDDVGGLCGVGWGDARHDMSERPLEPGGWGGIANGWMMRQRTDLKHREGCSRKAWHLPANECKQKSFFFLHLGISPVCHSKDSDTLGQYCCGLSRPSGTKRDSIAFTLARRRRVVAEKGVMPTASQPTRPKSLALCLHQDCSLRARKGDSQPWLISREVASIWGKTPVQEKNTSPLGLLWTWSCIQAAFWQGRSPL